jgi:hypothetical protein
MTTTGNDTPIVAVTTYMEESLAPRFQAWAQEAIEVLRRGGAPPALVASSAVTAPQVNGELAFVPLTPRQALERYPSAWENPHWADSKGDLERAIWLLNDLGTGNARRILAELIDAERLRGDELADRAGYAARGLPPALKHVATRCRQVARRPMWEFERDGEGYGHYWMDDATKLVFRRAFEAGLV